MQTDFDAIIVGAGPAGSTAATLLAQAGWSVALVEKQTFPRRKVCGECIAASNLPLLHALGVGAAFEAGAGAELRRVALLRGARRIVAELPAAADPRWRYGRALGRETLDTLLLERARTAGATVLQPWSVQAIGGVPGAHRCEIRSHEPVLGAGAQRDEVRAADPALARSPLRAFRSSDTACERRSNDIDRSAGVEPADRCATLRAPIVIAAHGSWEPLPSQRDARRRNRGAEDLFAFKANFSGAALDEGLLPVLSFDGGYGGMVVAERGITTLACCIRADRLDACRRAAPGVRAGEAVEALLRHECAGVAEALRHARRDGPWLASGPLEPGVRLRRDDALFRIGNAAGEAHPIIGEGISMAIQSAWLLCARLIEARPERACDAAAPDAAPVAGTGSPDPWRGAAPSVAWQREIQARYVADWCRHFVPRLRLAAAFAHAAMRPAAALPLVALLGHWPALLTHGAKWGGKLRCALDAATIGRLAARVAVDRSSVSAPSPASRAGPA